MALNILSIAPKDIYVTMEMSLADLRMIIRALDLSSIDYDGESRPEDKIAVMFLTKEFYPSIKEVITDLERGG
ncbi:MAG: hypothetical protein ACXABN_19380 [Candidatus Thorarchaeota archaeon]|jgi:hypothetical protein